LITDHELTRHAPLVGPEIQHRVIVALRQGQKQAVPPHEAQRNGGLAEGQAFAALEAPNGLHLGLAQIAGGEDLLLDRVSRRLNRDDFRFRRAIWIDVHCSIFPKITP